MLLIKQKNYEEEKKNYTFKPNINTNLNYYNKNQIRNDRENNNITNINNNMNRNILSNYNIFYQSKKLNQNNKNINDKNQSFQSNNQKIDKIILKKFSNNNKSSIYKNNNELIEEFKDKNISNLNYNKSQIPFSTKNKYINKSIRNKKNHNINEFNRQLSASKSSNTFNLNNDNGENKKIFENLFNDLCINKNNILECNNLNTNKVSKNILRIINPIIKELLKDKNRHIAKDDFLFYMHRSTCIHSADCITRSMPVPREISAASAVIRLLTPSGKLRVRLPCASG